MKIFKYLAFALLSKSAWANCLPIYLNVGLGGDFPGSNIHASADSYSLLYGPTVPGVSLFQLRNVEWTDDLRAGFDINAAIGYRFTQKWIGEVEAIYQNLKSYIGGEFNFLETDAATLNIFRQSGRDPLTTVSRRVHLYSLLFNGIYEFFNCDPWRTFAGVGVGAGWIHTKSTAAYNTLVVPSPVGAETYTPNIEYSPKLSGSSFLWQCKLGLAYYFKNDLALVVQYQLLNTLRFNAEMSAIQTNPYSPGNSIFSIPQANTNNITTNMINFDLRWGA